MGVHVVTWVLLVLHGSAILHAQTEDVLRPKGRPITEEERASSSWDRHPERIPLALLGEVGINANTFTQDLQRTFPAGTTPNDVLSGGSGWSWTLGAGAEYQLRNDLAVQMRVAIDRKSYANSVSGVLDYNDSASERPRDMAFVASTQAAVTYVSVSPCIRYDFTDRLFGTVGVSVHARLGDVTRRDVIDITDADPALGLNVDYGLQRGLFRSISREVVANTDMLQPIVQQYPAKSTEFVRYHTWRTGFDIGVGYRVPFDARTAVVVQLRYQRMLSVMSDAFMVTDYSRSTSQRLTEVTYGDARIHSVQLILGVWMKLLQ
ncbi:MAG: hypothetical protein ACKOBV_09690 [Candidatus Kapaibacterium sp.]